MNVRIHFQWIQFYVSILQISFQYSNHSLSRDEWQCEYLFFLNCLITWRVIFFPTPVLEIEPRTLQFLHKCSTIEPQAWMSFNDFPFSFLASLYIFSQHGAFYVKNRLCRHLCCWNYFNSCLHLFSWGKFIFRSFHVLWTHLKFSSLYLWSSHHLESCLWAFSCNC